MNKYLMGALLVGLLASCNRGGGGNPNTECPATITIQGTSYSPASCQIKAGSSITIEASGDHPLRGLGTDNPIPASSTTNQTITFDASTAGKTFEYECIVHGFFGMKGSIKVVSP